MSGGGDGGGRYRWTGRRASQLLVSSTTLSGSFGVRLKCADGGRLRVEAGQLYHETILSRVLHPVLLSPYPTTIVPSRCPFSSPPD